MDILEWLKTNIEEIESKLYISKHLNDFFSYDNFFSFGNKLLCEVEKQIFEGTLDCSEIKFELQFELLSLKNTFQGVPHSFLEFESRINKAIPPELIISKRKKGYLDYIPKIEYYMSPLPFIIEDLNGLDYFYTEYRTIDELNENESYTSWFNIVISPR
ncbi:hypothetical protein FVB9288_02258 [Flavobacterium sp. CECT 9288]|uniref:hypothetical protein n=1 Tax=Flavobacterium sp. CECT 9288 TaxID=2845819 RepID=UPI001E3E4795|nr:hypothetical protein [Flavobacterium sp. CECT 9288]CAH0336552.1 hypothetical protein FVB9288_02258 [Flavobacterium sp. CECT 9288]